MRRSSNISLWMVDLIGGALVLACVLLLGWTVFVRADDAAADLTHWRNLARQARHDIGALRTRRLEEQTRLEARQTELARSGRLPERSPTEQYFQALSKTAKSLNLRVIRQSPLPTQYYKGLTEQRFNYEVVGTCDALMAFLSAIEQTGFWADVSYISVGSTATGTGSHTAQLTLSLFAAPTVTDEEVRQP